MRRPSSSQQYVTIIDNKGRQKVQFVEYLVEDVRGEKVYVTSDGLAYVEYSLTVKLQAYLVAEFNRLPEILVQPEVVDFMVDYDPRTGQPYSFMSASFDKTYPLVIWALKLHMADERFDVPQAGLHNISLAEAFSWAYAHFILEDQPPLHKL